MECYFCGSTACPAAATNNRDDCLHCSDTAIEEERGILSYEAGEKAPPSDANQAFRKGYHGAQMHYLPR